MDRKNNEYQVQAKQIDDSQQIYVSWNCPKYVEFITLVVKHKTKIVSKTKICGDALKFGSCKITAFYGKHEVVAEFNSGEIVTKISAIVSIFAKKYVIAPLTATIPVTYFTLSLSKITKNFTIPTFVWFERVGVWNYHQMKKNLNLIPVLSKKDFMHNADCNKVFKKVREWVRELYELNPNSKFDFYFNDCSANGWLECVFCNNIPKSNYKVTLLYDGPTSNFFFNHRFDCEEYDIAYEKMRVEYAKMKENLKQNKLFFQNNMEAVKMLGEFNFVMLQEEENVFLWIANFENAMANNNEKVCSKINDLILKNKIIVKSLNALLNELSANDSDYVKLLYNFDDSIFLKAREQGKKPMIILGSWTEFEVSFEIYIKILDKLFGDEYLFFHKSHPKNPTEYVKGKAEKLNALGLIDIKNEFPAQLLFFFDKGLCASGYPSSTIYSLGKGKCKAVFNIRKSKSKEFYKDNVEVFISKIDSSDEDYGKFVKDENSFLLEFSNKKAIFSCKNNEINYF